MLQFVQIGVQMFDADFVIRPHDRPFKQAPNAFHVVCMHIAFYPFVLQRVLPFHVECRVIDAFVRLLLRRCRSLPPLGRSCRE